jgi:hypothetical protein
VLPSFQPNDMGNAGAPDVCTPLCDSLRNHPDCGAFNECVPGLECTTDAFANIDVAVCAPGYDGWRCLDDSSCASASCVNWGGDIFGAAYARFGTCAPRCKSDSDCPIFDRLGLNVTPRCEKGYCFAADSLLAATLSCVKESAACAAAQPNAHCQLFPFRSAGICVRPCNDSSECADLTSRLGVPFECAPSPLLGRFCQPVVPTVLQ